MKNPKKGKNTILLIIDFLTKKTTFEHSFYENQTKLNIKSKILKNLTVFCQGFLDFG